MNAPRRVSSESHDRLLDVQEAAVLLGVKPATLYQWAYKRRIPVVKLFGPRGALRFRLQDVERLIQDSLRPAMQPTEVEPEYGRSHFSRSLPHQGRRRL